MAAVIAPWWWWCACDIHSSNPSADAKVESHGPLDDDKTPADVRQEPLALVPGFEWSVVDVTDSKQVRVIVRSLTCAVNASLTIPYLGAAGGSV